LEKIFNQITKNNLKLYYFISDVHLGLLDRHLDRKREDLLLRVLDKIKEDAKVIYLVGDIFDYWFEYKEVIPSFFYRTLNKIYELTQAGIEIKYLMGNHDFGHRSFFFDEFGIEIIKEDIEINLFDKRIFISHGDGKSKKDLGYKILKAILRHPISNKLFNILHPDFGIGLAKSSSKKSRHHTDSKDYGETDGMRQFAFDKIDEGYDYVVMGHRHKAEKTKHNNGYYINLGEWLNNPTFASFDGDDFKIIYVNEFLVN